jgi:CheY-like chemotaxis protein
MHMSARYDTPVMLYVEDEESDVFFMRRAFRRSSTLWQLQTVPNGREAIAYIMGTAQYADRKIYPKPNLVLLDLNLPLLSGFEVLSAIRSEPEYVNLPVVVFSSSGRPEDRSRASELGANGYILKPSSGAEFNQTVTELAAFYEQCDRIAAAEARRGSIIRI